MKQTSTLLAVIAVTALLLIAALALQRSVTIPQPSRVLDPPVVETHPEAENNQGFLYGRVATVFGATYEGRLRWGGDEEAFWGDYFNGFKDKNPWADDLRRPFMARFGDIAQIEARGRDVHVTLKSGAVFDLGRLSAGDFDDGVRVWDDRQGVVDLDSLQILTIDFLPTPSSGAAPYRLHGTVRTRQGDFTGFVQWNREECVAPDELDGHTDQGELGLPYDAIRSIERHSRDSALVTLLDGREFVLSDGREVGQDNRGIYVDDRRYGRVLISWDVFERADFSPAGSGPAYGDFSPGGPLSGSVTTRAGGRFTGRLVFDLDESETVETLDAPSRGVDYTVQFGLIASIVLPDGKEDRARLVAVTLHDGEVLQLELRGDLGEGNAGMLIFVDGAQRAESVPWADVQQVDFDRPPATHPSP